MLKKRIDWVDFNGVKRSKDFLFNFTEAEIQEMNLRSPGGLEGKLKRISEEQDPNEIVSYFKSIILDSYGVKSEDGIRFIKSEELSREFSQTGAYVKLFMELSTNTEAAISFVKGIVPDVPEYVNKEKDTVVADAIGTYVPNRNEPYNVLANPVASSDM